MPHSPLSTAILREAAEAEDAYRSALSWVENHKTSGGQKPKVSVRWDAGSALGGYETVRLVVERDVQDRLARMIEDALTHLKARAEAKRRVAHRHLAEIEEGSE